MKDLSQSQLDFFIQMYRPKADETPEAIHKSWSEMTEAEKQITIFYLRNHTTSIIRVNVAGHAIGCHIREHGTITVEQMTSIWEAIV